MTTNVLGGVNPRCVTTRIILSLDAPALSLDAPHANATRAAKAKITLCAGNAALIVMQGDGRQSRLRIPETFLLVGAPGQTSMSAGRA